MKKNLLKKAFRKEIWTAVLVIVGLILLAIAVIMCINLGLGKSITDFDKLSWGIGSIIAILAGTNIYIWEVKNRFKEWYKDGMDIHDARIHKLPMRFIVLLHKEESIEKQQWEEFVNHTFFFPFKW